MISWLIVVSVVAALGVVWVVLVPATPLQWVNDGGVARCRNFVNLLGLTTTSLVIVTGRLHRGLYADPGVLRAFRDLPDGVDIAVYYDADALDVEGSGEFIKELERRKAVVEHIPRGILAHGAVFDGIHGKIEQFGIGDAEPDKPVEYFAYDRGRAREMRKSIDTVVTKARKERRGASLSAA